MIDAGDKDSVRKGQKQLKTKRAYELHQLNALLKTYEGRAFMWRLLSQCGIYHDNVFPDQPGASARQEGKRSIGLWMLREIEDADPHAYPRMRDEATQRELENVRSNPVSD